MEKSYSPEGETPQQRWAKSLEEVRRDFEFDGYRITEGLRILKSGEST
ncbi:hypothetical protein [Streptomyces rubiginosohelvolus]|uniref:Uncharacterized protein n=1 Tax=Streptomyces rubiginosohelvolus TaxID=67362 RepID=A0ABW6F8L0_9ACTN